MKRRHTLLTAMVWLAHAAAVGGGASPPPTAGWTAFVDAAHGFRIEHPKGFVVRGQDVSGTPLQPVPKAAIFIMNPTMASGDLAGIEPPDLAVRVYRADGVASAAGWLAAAGRAHAGEGAVTRPYRHRSVEGIEVCAATLLAPGCSIYVLGGGRMYQLTPISLEGEAMVKTFALLP